MPQPQAISVLKKRSDFLAVASARRKWVTPAFIVQIAPRPLESVPENEITPIGLGLTTSKKMVGNAVQRNRARRRLRALAREVLASNAAPQTNYVLIARADALVRDYEALRRDLQWALKKLTVWRES